MAAQAIPFFRFDGRNEHAQAVAQKVAASLVTRVSRETQAALRAVVVRSIEEGISPLDSARMIRGLVGLTEKDANAAITYRATLIDQGLNLDRVDVLTERYEAKKLRERALTIARTEVMQALNVGALEAAAQAQDEGLLSPDAVKEWLTTPDEKLCPVCEPMDGVQVKLDEKFQTSKGPLAGPPGHPRCRCAVAYSEPDR